MKLDLKYDGPYKFSGIGTHLGSGETFEIIEGEVNKRTKYWKFIALYENSLKKVKGKMNEKRLVQVPYNIMSLKNLLQDFWSKIFHYERTVHMRPDTVGLVHLVLYFQL